MNTEQVREYAGRWSHWTTTPYTDAWRLLARIVGAVDGPLTDVEHDSLLSWVSTWSSAYAPLFGGWIECERVEKSAWLAADLRLSDVDARALFDAAIEVGQA